MLESPQKDELINLEKERLKVIFIKEKYNQEEKLDFIKEKIKYAKIEKDEISLKACNLLLKELED